MKSILLSGIVLATLLRQTATAQSLAINTDGSTAHASAILDVKSTLKGMLIPRMSKTEKNAIPTPATGLFIYQSGPDSTGFYYYNGSSWTWLSNNLTGWSTTGNTGTTPAANFLGTTDNNALAIRTNNAERMRITTNGEVGIGTTTPNSSYGYARLELASEGFGAPTDMLVRNAVNNAGYAPGYVLQHARGTLATPTAVINGDYLGTFTSMNYDGSNYLQTSAIDLWTDGPVSTNKVPTRFQFMTMDTGGVYTTRMIIKSNGLIGIGTSTPGDKLEINGNLRFTGVDTIYAAPSTTGSGKSIWMRAGNPFVPVGGSGGSINIEATNNMPSGGSGYGNLGPSGVINLTAGSGYNTAGGNINITAGQSSYWALVNDSHSDVILKGGYNINAPDAATLTTEGGRIVSFNSTTSNGGNLVLKPGTGAGGGANGYIHLDGIIAMTVSLGLGGGSSGSPVSLLNQKSFTGLLPADGVNNYYQLPSPVTYSGRMYYIRNNSSTFSAVLVTAAGLLYPGSSSAGSSSFTLNAGSSPKTVLALSDGQNWIILKQD